MKFVLLGHLGVPYIGKPDERADKAYLKAKELGITVLHRFLTLGRYDYCTIIEAPSAAVASAFTTGTLGKNSAIFSSSSRMTMRPSPRWLR